MGKQLSTTTTSSPCSNYLGYGYGGTEGFHSCTFMTCEAGINLMSYGNIYANLPGLTQQLKQRTCSGQENKLHLLTSRLGCIPSGMHVEPDSCPGKKSCCRTKRGRDLKSSATLIKLRSTGRGKNECKYLILLFLFRS